MTTPDDSSARPAGAPAPRRRRVLRWRPVRSRRLLAAPLGILGVVVVAFAMIMALGGGSSQGSTPQVSTDPSVIAAGQELFDLHCSSCHGVDGVGTTRAPSLIDEGAAAADFYLRTGRMPLNNPADEPITNRPFFDNQDIEAIDSYVAALPSINHVTTSGPAIPEVLPLCSSAEADSSATMAAERAGTSKCVTLSFGQQTFALNCAQCHQIAGSGGDLSDGDVIPSLQNASLTEVAEAIRIGPGAMPIFSSGQLTDDQASAVSQYAQYLRHPDAPGGLRISGFGPVAEGFVGIIVGLGLLLLVSRLMGTRS